MWTIADFPEANSLTSSQRLVPAHNSRYDLHRLVCANRLRDGEFHLRDLGRIPSDQRATKAVHAHSYVRVTFKTPKLHLIMCLLISFLVVLMLFTGIAVALQ